ncbi:MAG: response regulator [Opitutales bacterium]
MSEPDAMSSPSHASLTEAMRGFSSHLAHDLNNQLATIRLGTQMLERSVETDAGLEVLRMVNRSIDRATRLVSDLGIYASGVRGEPEPVALSPFLETLVDEVNEELPSGARLQADFPPDLPQLDLHRDALGRSLRLLLSFLGGRLTDASEAGGRVELVAILESEHLLLRIEAPLSLVEGDAGAEAFVPFFNKGTTSRGTGMALAVLDRVFRDHGGAVEVTGPAKDQTVIELRLPLLLHGSGSALPPVGSAEAVASSPELEGSQTILIIDDEEPLLDMVGGILRAQKANVLLASSAVEGMKQFKRNQEAIDLLICDVKLPGLPGGELVAAVRSVREALPVLFLSGAEPAEVGQLPENCQFLGKPFGEADLLEAIGQLTCGVPSG